MSEVESIGVVQSEFKEPADPEEIRKEESTIIVEPEYAPIFADKFCAECGEKIMAPKAIEEGDKDLCICCAEADYLQLDGRGLNRIEQE